MRDRSTAFCLVLQLFLAVALADSTQNTTTTGSNNLETRVGWYAGPTERGTLTLVYSCLATIITCTWTVLHLNVPAADDRPWTRGLRKAKWMVITILFPEFIFAKAICELRSALYDLLEFNKTLRKEYQDGLTCKVQRSFQQFKEKVEHVWSWEIKFPQGGVVGLIYPLMGLPRPDLSSPDNGGIAGASGDGLGNNATVWNRCRNELLLTRAHMPEKTNQAKAFIHTITKPQYWTLTHSYLANMGGLVYIPRGEQKNDPYVILTCDKLSRRCGWLGEQEGHPLRSLVLSENEIKDKSKADWLLKTLAILQISWLVLTVLARFILELPLTQLEIATLSFSVFAIATFIANWWKPKDISTPIRIPCVAEAVYRSEYRLQEERDPGLHAFDWTQSFVSRLVSPAKTRSASEWREKGRLRIENDMVEMKGNIPLLATLMAVAGLVFGGLHCLAWTFAFPSRTELLLWRVASIVSAIVPFISLVTSIWLNYLVTSFLDKWLMAELQPLAKLNQEYIDLLRDADFVTWTLDEQTSLYARSEENRNLDTKPTEQEQEELKKNREVRAMYLPTAMLMPAWHCHLRDFLNTWMSSHRPHASTTSQLQAFHSSMKSALPNIIMDIWEEYEKSYIQEKAGTSLASFTCTGHIKATMDKFETKQRERTESTDWASSMVAITSGILYTAARVIILVLVFASLRDVPIGVYEATPWTRFLPSFS